MSYPIKTKSHRMSSTERRQVLDAHIYLNSCEEVKL
jgi:hypothetical protein